ncbi:SLC13A5, partial [Cordylochernes scorpioides]
MLGFMLTTTVLSMWISNTATTAMMVPIVQAVVDQLSKEREARQYGTYIHLSAEQAESPAVSTITLDMERAGKKEKTPQTDMAQLKQLRTALYLSVAFSANIGGTGTLIGSGPNLVLQGYLSECQDSREEDEAARTIISDSYKELGPMRMHEKGVLSLFMLLVLLWFFRDPQFIPGWADLLPHGDMIRDATASVGVSILLFILPSGHGKPLLDWPTAQRKVPWGLLLLLGSGFAMAEGTQASGMSTWISQQLEGLKQLSPAVIMVTVTLGTSALTEIISNMSMATIVLPVVAQLALALSVHPLYLTLPVTIGCSFAFILPVGNPSNAIVYEGSGMPSSSMMLPGAVVKLITLAVEMLMIQTMGFAVWDLGTLPSWAIAAQNA